MNSNRLRSLGTLLVPVVLLGTAIGIASPTPAPAAPSAQPGNFADEAFKTTWTRTDQLVNDGKVKRSFYWGPTPGFTTYEDYAEGPNGKHLVQYFDKSRMEINNPNGDKKNPFYVTNGLLTEELISGRMQVGNTQFVQRFPAEIDIASDTDDRGEGTPTYASFRSVYPNYGANNRTGETVIDTINRLGQVGTGAGYINAGIKYVYFEPVTKHNIPDVFWKFLNQTGPVIIDGKVTNARLSDPYFYATGYPITEAYWASVKIAGMANTDVLIQPYERRVLTYVPTAPEGFKVQMGNIGMHYYDWRYKATFPTPIPTVFATPGPTSCQEVPVRGFGKVWADHPEVRRFLGCPFGTERQVTVAQESFEHGQMIDVIETFGSGQYQNTYKVIYVLFDDGTIQRFQDMYKDGDPEPTPSTQPPPGLYTPVRGFGKVWREGTGARVRERLGWATTQEVGSNQGAVLNFQFGTMVYAGPTLKKIYVLYSNNSYGGYDLNRWAVYDDTYQP